MRSQAGRRARRVLAFSAAAVLFGVVACAARVDDPAQKQDIPAKALAAHSARHLHGPVSAVLRASRTHGQLTASQERRLSTIESELQVDRSGRRAMHRELRASAAAVVRSGTADSRVFNKSVDEAVRVFKQRADATESALEELHAILKPDQRKAVAAALRARIDEKYGHRHRGRHHGFGRLASYLMLSQRQVDELESMKKQLFGEKKHLRPSRAELLALVDAFKGDNFDSALEAFRADKLAILRDRVAQAGQRTDTLLAIFTPEQRDLLADLILQGPEKVLLGAPQGADTARTSVTAR
jgi:Spy/CpxP family protein refolding chaperone